MLLEKTYWRQLDILKVVLFSTVVMFAHFYYVFLVDMAGQLKVIYWFIQVIVVISVFIFSLTAFSKIHVGKEGIEIGGLFRKSNYVTYANIRQVKRKKEWYVFYLRRGNDIHLSREHFHDEFLQEEFEELIRRKKVRLVCT